jgi:hypothetical protein
MLERSWTLQSAAWWIWGAVHIIFLVGRREPRIGHRQLVVVLSDLPHGCLPDQRSSRCRVPGVRSLSRDIRRACFGWLLVAALLAATPAHADYPVAPDVVVFCEPTLQHALTNVAALWCSESGVKARIFTAPTTALLLAEITHRARDEVIIGEGDANADAAKTQQLIKPDSLHPLGPQPSRNRRVQWQRPSN